jgi:DNA repair protein RadA/Sms
MAAPPYICAACGSPRKRYVSRCECGGCLTIITLDEARRRKMAVPMGLNPGPKKAVHYMLTRILGFDEVCSKGPGIVRGATYSFSGEAGGGKSTILLQAASHLSRRYRVSYSFLEPGGDFVRMTAERIGIDISHVRELEGDTLDELIERSAGSDVVIIDSASELAKRSGMPLDEIARRFTVHGHETHTTYILICHINAEGDIAGVVATEHAVDATMHLSREYGAGVRVLSSGKNRYGPERVRFLKMTEDKGLVDVPSMSSHLLTDRIPGTPGSCVAVPLVLGRKMDGKQGSTPVLVEVQALVGLVPSNAETGRLMRQPRLTPDGGGLTASRLRRILDVLRLRADVDTSAYDVTVGVCGDLEIDDKALDMPIALAIASAFCKVPLPDNFSAWGELDLNGIVRGVVRTDDRLEEAARAKFTPAKRTPWVTSGSRLVDIISKHIGTLTPARQERDDEHNEERDEDRPRRPVRASKKIKRKARRALGKKMPRSPGTVQQVFAHQFANTRPKNGKGARSASPHGA